MTKSKTKPARHEYFHKDGTLHGRGELTGGVMTGHWEWFRKDGSKMRAGSFKDGVQVGDWTTYDRKGRVVKVTRMKGKV
jgi:antitoxin component YwqK of YwqJK toxin-antitoxin module